MNVGRQGDTDERLPLRWLVIFAVSAAAGILVGFKAGLDSGVTVGIAAAGLLHMVTR